MKNSDRFGGPWIPPSLLKILTDSAVRGSLHPDLLIRTDSAVLGSFFKNSDRFGGPWKPASLLKILTDSAVRGFLHLFEKFRPIQRSVDPAFKIWI